MTFSGVLRRAARPSRRRPPARPSRRRHVPGVGEEDVEEAGPGDLDAVDRVAQPLGTARRRAARRSRAAARPARARAASPRWSSSRRSRPSSGAPGVGARARARACRCAGRRRRPRRRRAARRAGRSGTSVMVGLAGEDLVGPEELLEQHDPGELVRERHRAERELVVGARRARSRTAPPITKHDVAARLAALLQPARRTPRSRRPRRRRRAARRTRARGSGARSASSSRDLDHSTRAWRAQQLLRSAATSSTYGGRSLPTASTM